MLVLLSVAVALGCAEIFFRLTAPHIIRRNSAAPAGKEVRSGDYGYFMDSLSGRRLIPNTHVVRVESDGSRIPIDINAAGFRDEEIAARKSPGETRILVLGDSVTFGAYFPVADSYPRQLEALLRAKNKAGAVRCINAGVEGIGLRDEVDVLVERGLAVYPDLVIVGFFLNDSTPPDRLAAGLANPGFVRRHSVLAQTVFRAYKMWQFAHGRMEGADTYAWMAYPPPADWRTNRASFLAYAQVAEKDWGAAWKEESWAVIDEQLVRLRGLAERHNFRVMIVAFPVAYQVYAEYLEDRPQQQLGRLARKHGFRYQDLLPAFRSRAADEGLFIDHCHLTPHGAALAAGTIAAALTDTDVLGGNQDEGAVQ